jgi:hypothetical protein
MIGPTSFCEERLASFWNRSPLESGFLLRNGNTVHIIHK